MKNLFVSDLDGTLLQNDATLSPYARKELTRMLNDGVQFSIATARSITSVKEILGDLPIDLPVVCANGAYVSNLKTGEHTSVHGIQKPIDSEILEIILKHDLEPFISSYDGQTDHLYIEKAGNIGLEWYLKDRMDARDPRLHRITDFGAVMNESVICYNILERWDRLAPLKKELEQAYPHQINQYIYENWYLPDWYWLSVFDQHATKGHALSKIIDKMGLSPAQLTVFGDNANDESMFIFAGNSIAPENALPQIKSLATEIIGTNETDSVVKYIAKATDHR